MKSFFLKASRYAKRIQDSRDRIQTLQQMADKTEWNIKDFTQFGQLMPRKDFTAEHDTSIYNIDDDCVDVMMYPQMYYIQLLKNGMWLYQNIFDKITYDDRKLEKVEEYVYNQITDIERRTDFKGYR
jgi:hypothetical protein